MAIPQMPYKPPPPSKRKKTVDKQPPFAVTVALCKVCRLPLTMRREVEAAMASGWAQRDIVSHWNDILANFEDYGPNYLKQSSVSTHARRHLSVTQASIRRIIEKKALEFGEDVEAISDFMLTKEAVLEAIMTTGLQDIAKGLSHVEPRELIEALKLKYQLDNQSEGIAQDELYRQFFAFQDAVKQIVSPEQRELIAAQFEKNLQTTAPRALPASVKVPSTVIVETPVLKDENKIEVPVEEGEFTEVHEDVSE